MRVFFYLSLIVTLSALKVNAQKRDFYEISRLPFTSDQFDEFAPAYYRQGIVYTTNHKRGFLISRMTSEGEPLFNIYHVDQRRSGIWRNPELLSKSLKSNYHDGPASFSPDGSRIYFTSNLRGKGGESLKLGIFMAEFSGGKWINITPFPYNSSNYNITHPALSRDGKTLYFASDMPGGSGGMDIYVSTFQGSGWTAPENLGEPINSAKEEIFPYMHPGGRLYFSSTNGTNGQLDLFYSTSGNNKWNTPIRLPSPFNSEADDFGFIADQDIGTGYFTSNREGTDNIYSFVSTFPLFTQCDSIRGPVLCYTFFEQTGEVDTVTYYFEWDMGDGTRIRGLEADHCFEDIGSYSVRLDVIDILTGEMAYNQASYQFRIDQAEQPFIKSPDTCYVGQQITLDASETYLKNFDVEDYYWELGDGTKIAGEIINHTYNRPGIYQVQLGVLSDPDSPFGQQRSCVYKYIVVFENPPAGYNSQ